MTNAQKILMLQAEAAALLHDIGKLSKEFVATGVKAMKGDLQAHAYAYHESCLPELGKWLFKSEEAAKYLSTPGDAKQLRAFGDLLTCHHSSNEEYDYCPDSKDRPDKHPLLLLLLTCADLIDSAYTKGAGANPGKSRLKFESAYLRQDKDSCHLATPFGGLQRKIDIESLDELSMKLQKELAALLEKTFSAPGDEQETIVRSLEMRNGVLKLLEKYGKDELAETRLPTNNVSLWQHSFSVASIFKALLARRLLLQHYEAPLEKKELAFHTERLALLAIRWDEAELLARAARPGEIAGLTAALDEAAQRVKDYVETQACLGNCIFEDRHGIYFLVPAKTHPEDAVAKALAECCAQAENLLGGERLEGALPWQALYKDIGLNMLGLSELIFAVLNTPPQGVELLGSGPNRPDWIKNWLQRAGDAEICAHCGLRPVEFSRGAPAGSDADADRVCQFCSDIEKWGQDKRKDNSGASGSYYMTFKTDDLASGDENRIALIQGVVDLRAFLDSSAFSSLLGASPTMYRLDGKPCGWDDLFDVGDRKSFAELSVLLGNSKFGTIKDGWASGVLPEDKAEGYLRDIVYASRYASSTDSADRSAQIALFGLRQHPAPSRLLRVLERSLDFCEFPMQQCEESAIQYAPLTRDARSFQLLTGAAKSWDLLLAIQKRYEQEFGRVRHLAPLHLSVTVFYKKAPLYVALDAARRFAALAAKRGEEAWRLEAVEELESKRRLTWRDSRNRPVVWDVPLGLCCADKDKKDLFYSWYWPTTPGARHPHHLGQLAVGESYLVRPSTFDYEVLDATTRRFDIREAEPETHARPHFIVRGAGPRPYPLETLREWERLISLRQVSNKQRKSLLQQLAGLHMDWKPHYDEERQHLARTNMRLAFGEERYQANAELLDPMAADGQLLDLFEWQDFIRRLGQRGDDKELETT